MKPFSKQYTFKVFVFIKHTTNHIHNLSLDLSMPVNVYGPCLCGIETEKERDRQRERGAWGKGRERVKETPCLLKGHVLCLSAWEICMEWRPQCKWCCDVEAGAWKRGERKGQISCPVTVMTLRQCQSLLAPSHCPCCCFHHFFSLCLVSRATRCHMEMKVCISWPHNAPAWAGL